MAIDTSNLIIQNPVEEEESDTFDFVKIGLSSPQRILSWSYGEVTKPETINYRTLKPEMDGLFCERVFGPAKDWECHCGKYKRVRHKGIICERCGVEVTESKVRRHRMGHIKLSAPVTHIWYLKGIPSHLSLLIDMPLRHLEEVNYYNSYVVIDPGNVEGISKKQLLSEDEYEDIYMDENNQFHAEMGAPALKKLLAEINFEEQAVELRGLIETSSNQKKAKLIKRLRVVESFIASGANPTWAVLEVLPVIPPDLRPMVQLDGGRFATSDLNDLYRRVINRNNRLKRLLDMEAPDIIIRNEKRMLQEAVDALIDNGRRGRAVVGANNRALKSLSDIIEGKQGRFRQNLLGKRVDYSGRSVIVVGPSLKLHQCGLPKEMALELFKPFVIQKLVDKKIVQNIKSAKKMIEAQKKDVWDVLETVIKGHPVLLNRAPTLHRLGIQAFEPILMEGRAIRLHPLVCTAFNADFDGDQMAVHVPLSIEAQTEARLLMLASNNILLPATGNPIITPSQDMVLGCYYMSVDNPDTKHDTKKIFANMSEVISAYQIRSVHLHDRIKLRLPIEKVKDDDLAYDRLEEKGKPKLLSDILAEFPHKQNVYIDTTIGRVIFNDVLPDSFTFINKIIDKKALANVVAECFLKHGNVKTSDLCNELKNLGFRFATRAGISITISDLHVPEQKKDIISNSEKEIEKSQKLYLRGEISAVERSAKVIDTWSQATELLTNSITDRFHGPDRLNSVYMMAFSGARGNMSQVRQLVGMRGLMSDPSGRTIDLPIKSNFREGLNVTEYVISSYGARKGLVDTALRTADSGYLTRRLADVAQDVIIFEDDCGTKKSLNLISIKDGDKTIVNLQDRLPGRFTVEDIIDPKTKDIIIEKDKMIYPAHAQKIIDAKYTQVKVRSVLLCQSKFGVCRKCYGWSLATKKLVNMGEAVGIIAAQSIGEPGTQLTMRTFHTGGVFEAASKRRIEAGHNGVIKYDKAEFEAATKDFRTPYGEVTKITEKDLKISVETKTGKQYKVSIPTGFIVWVKSEDEVKKSTVIAEEGAIKANTSQKSVEKAYRDINSDISGMVKFHDFEPEVKKDRQGIVTRIANKKGVVWVLSGDVYNLPSNAEMLVDGSKNLKKGQSIARISTKTEYGGKVQINNLKDNGEWESLSFITAELSLPNPEVVSNNKETNLVFPDDSPVNVFKLLVNKNSKIEDGMSIAEAPIDKYTVPTSGEIRYIDIKSKDKNDVISGKSKLRFLPEEIFTLSSKVNPIIEESCMVEPGTEIIPGVHVQESGFVSLENFELSQEIVFYPGAQGSYFPMENSNINITEGEEIKEGHLIGQIVEEIPLDENSEEPPEGPPKTEEIYSTTKGIVQFIHNDEGMFIVVRKSVVYKVEPINKFYEVDSSDNPIDLIPVTKLAVKNGDRIKEGTTLVKANLVFKLGEPLNYLTGKVNLKNVSEEESEEGTISRSKMSISIIENVSPPADLSNYSLLGLTDLKINNILQVKEGEILEPGKIVSFTEYIVGNEAKFELYNDDDSSVNEIILVTNKHLKEINVKKDDLLMDVKKSQFIYEGDKLSEEITLTDSGIVESVTKDKVVFRKAKPYLVSAGAQILVEEKEMVQQGETLSVLIYDQVKTGDIIQGLPRVEELLEARRPKESAILAQQDGFLKLNMVDSELENLEIIDSDGNTHTYKTPINSYPIVPDGQKVKKGEKLIAGPINPYDLLALRGVESVQRFIVNGVQGVYRSQGVDINDKHIEIIVRQMTKKLRIVEPGSSTLLPGEIVTPYFFDKLTEEYKKKKLDLPIVENVLLGITKASLNTESFISAASFQETTRVLTEASIHGKRDWLRGLKENVIIGRLIPAGTGMKAVQKASEQRERDTLDITIG